MDITALIISILALLISGASFYWSSLRVVKKLHLVRIDNFKSTKNPQFAIVNAGTKDVLITNIETCYVLKENNGRSYLPQRIETEGPAGETLLVESGKALTCTVTFLEDMPIATIKAGFKRDGFEVESYKLDYEVHVTWADISGNEFKAESAISQHTYTIDGDLRMWGPLTKTVELYSIAKAN